MAKAESANRHDGDLAQIQCVWMAEGTWAESR